jgi:hypothetical protein
VDSNSEGGSRNAESHGGRGERGRRSAFTGRGCVVPTSRSGFAWKGPYRGSPLFGRGCAWSGRHRRAPIGRVAETTSVFGLQSLCFVRWRRQSK